MADYTIQALPTVFEGYTFRSRTEARWAVLFKQLGIDFIYEPEGFELEGIRYLPDFFLPHVRMWAEVKPVEFTEEETHKCELLADMTGRPCFFLVGEPEFKTYWAIHPLNPETGTRYRTDYLLDIDWHGRKFYDGPERKFFGQCNEYWHGKITELAFSDEYRAAVHRARSMRFSESGRW